MISLIARLTIKEGREKDAIDLIKGLMSHVAKCGNRDAETAGNRDVRQFISS